MAIWNILHPCGIGILWPFGNFIVPNLKYHPIGILHIPKKNLATDGIQM
jgi:hypothetical protein